MFFSFSGTQDFYATKFHELTIREIESFWARCGYWLIDCVK